MRLFFSNMKPNESNNNLTKENSIVQSNSIIIGNENLNVINKDNFNTSDSSNINNKQKDNSMTNNNIKEKPMKNIILPNDIQEKFSEKVTFHTSPSNQGQISLKEKINQKKVKSSNIRNKKPKKKVKFKTNFVKIIEVKSFKKFNANRYLNNSNCINCSCNIF